MNLHAKKFCSLVFVILYLYIRNTESISVMSVDMGSEWLKIAIVKPGVPMEIALNKQSKRKTPFALSMKGNEREFGDPAYGVAIKQPNKAYLYLNHLLGKKFNSEAVKVYQKRFPHYELVEDPDRGTVLFKGEDDQVHSVEELVGMMLNHTRQTAAAFANHPMKDIVLTVPVFYNQAERKALLDAANMTGMNVLQLMNDNTAVALNYGIFRASTFNSTPKHIMFYDMGASHTTATIVTYSTTKVKDRGYLETVPQVVVKGVGFDTTLGGLEMDMIMRDYLVKHFKQTHKTKKDISESPKAMAKLLKEARRVRQVLSANTDHMAQIENVFEEQNFKLKITRAEFEEMCKDLFARVTKPMKMALDASSIPKNEIESVILMGGGSRIPKVQELLLEFSGKKELGKNINTDEAAALGAVYKGADLTAGFKVKRFLVKDLNLFPVDVQFERHSDNGEMRHLNRNLYHRLNPLPQKKIMTFNKKPTDFHFNVSYGDLSFLSKELKDTLILDQLYHVKLSGVDAAHTKNEKATPKGVKAFFNMDESGILHVEKVEAHFEKTPEMVEEEEQSTFAKLGSKLSSFFGSSKKEEEVVSENNEETKPEGGEEKKKDEEKPTKDDAKEESKEKPKDEATEDTTKKEEKPKEETKEKSEEKKEKTAKAEDGKNTTNANSTDNKASNTTEKAKPAKPAIVKESIVFAHASLGVPTLTKEKFDASVKKLHDLEARDQAKLATEQAYNNLESYIFEFKELLTREDVEKLSTSDERESLREKFDEASDWLDENGFEADEKTLKSKQKALVEVASDLQLRLSESEGRPKAIASMLESLNISTVFMESIKKMSDAKEIYTDKDLKDMEKIYSESKEWLMTNWKKQNETDPTIKPVMLIKDIIYQQGKLDRELMYIINKAKYYVPKPKPKPNATESNTTKANKTENTKKNANDTVVDENKKEDNKSEGVKSSDDEKKENTSDEKNKKQDKEEDEPVILELDSSDKKEEEKPKTENKEPETKPDNKKSEGHTPEDEL